MRKFEKISFNQFEKDITTNKKIYENYLMPKRSTKYSAGYDFYAISDIIIEPGESLLIPTGIKAIMESDEVLLLVDKSGLGTKYNLRLCNQIGIIDKDYYNNINNEGHIFVKLQNEGKDTVIIKQNKGFIQGLFIKYLTVDNEEEINDNRIGGFGSTSKKED